MAEITCLFVAMEAVVAGGVLFASLCVAWRDSVMIEVGWRRVKGGYFLLWPAGSRAREAV